METAFRNSKRLPFATALAAKTYGIDNITAPATDDPVLQLCMAILRNDNLEVKKWLDSDIGINCRTDPDGWHPLIYAIYYRNDRAVELLLKAGADISLPDYAGRTPLMIAAICGKSELIRRFIANGADIFKRDIRGKNVLDFAREYYQYECSEILEKYFGKGDRKYGR